MNIDLIHNKIIKDTVSDGFIDAMLSSVAPSLSAEYGDAVLGIQMYEDHLSSDLVSDGEFYYPLTVILDTGAIQRWIKWNVSNKALFKISPYSYKGSEPLKIELCSVVPDGFENKIAGRSIYSSPEGVQMNLQAASSDKTFLAGKYSQTFIDAMAREITKQIADEFGIINIEKSSLSLLMAFAPDTYMEHVIDNVTYRRLLVSAKGCSARDLWIKWSRRDGAAPVTVSEHLDENDVIFEIAEDVSQRIREREYRFLIRASLDKYQNAMGRKNLTEWRELIKRMLKRGEIEKLEIAEPEKALDDINEKLKSVLGNTVDVDGEKNLEESESDDIAALLKAALGENNDVLEAEPQTADLFDAAEKSELEDGSLDAPFEIEEDEEPELPEETEEEPEEEPEAPRESAEEMRRRIEEEMRRELEEKIRREYEEKLLESERIKAENERLLLERQAKEAERLAREAKEEEARRIREEERLAELREREKIAEQARLALIEEQRRLAEEERLRREAEERARAEKAAREAEEAKAREQKRIKEEMQRREAEEKRVNAARVETSSQYNYVSKKVKLIFRQPVDPNVTKRIHEIILTTIKYYHKENIYMKIKATVPDINTVKLDFIKVPQTELQLIVDIINVLGRSNIGITKATLE